MGMPSYLRMNVSFNLDFNKLISFIPTFFLLMHNEERMLLFFFFFWYNGGSYKVVYMLNSLHFFLPFFLWVGNDFLLLNSFKNFRSSINFFFLVILSVFIVYCKLRYSMICFIVQLCA